MCCHGRVGSESYHVGAGVRRVSTQGRGWVGGVLTAGRAAWPWDVTMGGVRRVAKQRRRQQW